MKEKNSFLFHSNFRSNFATCKYDDKIYIYKESTQYCSGINICTVSGIMKEMLLFNRDREISLERLQH